MVRDDGRSDQATAGLRRTRATTRPTNPAMPHIASDEGSGTADGPTCMVIESAVAPEPYVYTYVPDVNPRLVKVEPAYVLLELNIVPET